MTLQIQHLTRHFSSLAALDDVSLEIAPGEFVALLGPSGSGKTTLLRILAGLDYPDRGQVTFHGKDFLAAPARRRRVGLVFQHYALFSHLTVAENVAFGLRVRPWRSRPPRREIRDRVQALLERVQLGDLGARYPSQLSGGQRQRVALARALAVEPDILLLDEPFGALDAQVRVTLRRWLRELHEDLGLTTVFVTHDQEEALELSDRVAVMNQGRIEQVGSPGAIYREPATPFVCQFIGKVNTVPLDVQGDRLVAHGWALTQAPDWAKAQPCAAYVRPEQFSVNVEEPGGGAWKGQLRHVYLAGSIAHLDVHVVALDRSLEVDIPSDTLGRLSLVPGSGLWLRPRAAHVFAVSQEPGSSSCRWNWREQGRGESQLGTHASP